MARHEALNMLAVGDLVLQLPDPESYFEFTAPLLNAADIVVGQGEVVFTDRGVCSSTDVAATPCNPVNMSALKYAGFDVITLAGNHVWDSGNAGIEDTISGLKKYDIACTGAGMNIKEARKPAIVQRGGTVFGFLSYNCIGPRESWATEKKAGGAYVKILTHYELDHAGPGGPPSIYTFAEPRSLQEMINDIKALRSHCDVLSVALHKGIGHTPAKIAGYEQQVSYAAIDAGADLILGHHSHILRGMEIYRGKTIFHGLCNFVCVTRDLSVDKSKGDQQWAKRRKEIFGFEPDPDYPNYPFHPEAKQTIIAKCEILNKRITKVSYLPCFVNKKAQPLILKNNKKGQKIFDYIEKITHIANLNARYRWDGDEVVIY